MFSASV